MVGFGYVGLEKELEEHPNTIAPRDFASSWHKVGSIEAVPCYTGPVLLEF